MFLAVLIIFCRPSFLQRWSGYVY